MINLARRHASKATMLSDGSCGRRAMARAERMIPTPDFITNLRTGWLKEMRRRTRLDSSIFLLCGVFRSSGAPLLRDKILYVDTFVDMLRKFSRTIQVNVISNGCYSGIYVEKYRIDNQKLQLYPQLPWAWDEAMYIFWDPRVTHSTGPLSLPSSTGLLERSLQDMVA